MKEKVAILLFAVISVVILGASISNQSIWIDEAMTYGYVRQPDLAAFAQRLMTDTNSEAQMPLGMLQFYLCAKVFGVSELALRIPNLIWLTSGILAFVSIGKRFAIPWLPLLIALHPMVWYYADEARPYAMQVGLSSLLLMATVSILEDPGPGTRTWTLWFVSGVLLSATSLMSAMIFAVWAFVLAGFSYKKILKWSRQTLVTALLSGLVLFGLLIYYTWTLLQGAGGARLWSVGIGNLAFTVFELIGGMGFSPGRIILRESGRKGAGDIVNVMRIYLPLIFCLGTLLAAGLLARPRRMNPAGPTGLFKTVCCIFLFSVLGISSLSLVMHFPFWGRHFIPLLPLLILIVALRIRRIRNPLQTVLLTGLVFLWGAGSFNQRFNPCHRKDDYRTAAQVAEKAVQLHKKVLWTANTEILNYYTIEPTWTFLNAKDSEEWREADMVIYTKGDIFDPENTIATWLNQSSMSLVSEFSAFTVWERTSK